jgi:hypothetical protein
MTIATLTTEKTTMKNYQLLIASLAFACSLLACAPDVLAQQKSAQNTSAPTAAVKPAAVAKPAAEETESALPNTGSQQGIKVHGHWVIDVRNPDGTLAQHHEFENSMQDQGFNLVNLLAGTATVGEPVIVLGNGGTTTFCGSAYCYLSEYSNGQFMKSVNSGAGCPGATSACAATLVPTVIATGPQVGNQAFSLKLTGQMTAIQAGPIGAVGTIFWNCVTSNSTLSTSSPSICASQTNVPANTILLAPGNNSTLLSYFTYTTFNVISVVTGQIVQVSVTISFS